MGLYRRNSPFNKKREVRKNHKDIDIFIDQYAFPEIEKHLKKLGYQLLLTHQNPSSLEKEIHEPFNFVALKERGGTILVAKDKNDDDMEESDFLRYLDIYLIKRNDAGNFIDDVGNPLPIEWFKQVQTKFRDYLVPLEDPRKTIYYRLTSRRDFELIKQYAKSEHLTKEDIDLIGKILTARTDKQIERMTQMAKRLSCSIANADETEIYQQLLQDKNFRRRAIQLAEPLKKVAHAISQDSNRSFEAILTAVYTIWNPELDRQKFREQVEELQKAV